MNAILMVSSPRAAADNIGARMATDSNNAAFMNLIVLSPQWKDDARPATSNENTGTKDTVVGVICLVIVFGSVRLHS